MLRPYRDATAIARTLGLLALLLAVALVDDQVVAGRPNGIADLNGRDRPGVERDRQRVRSEIDGSLADSLQMPGPVCSTWFAQDAQLISSTGNSFLSMFLAMTRFFELLQKTKTIPKDDSHHP